MLVFFDQDVRGLNIDYAARGANNEVNNTSGNDLKELFSLDEVLSGGFGRQFNGTWISDTEFIYSTFDNKIFQFDATNRRTRFLLQNDLLVSTREYLTFLSSTKIRKNKYCFFGLPHFCSCTNI